jgi:hypothetical protein
MISTRTALAALAALALTASAHAGEEKKGDKKKDSAVDAFFDDAPAKKPNSLEALQKAADDVAHKETKSLAPKAATVEDEAKIQFFTVFAAEKIVIDKKTGCQPAGRDKKKLTFFTFDEVPSEGVPFSVCVTMQSRAGRAMAMSVAIVDPRNARVVKAEDVVDFAGRTQRLDHVLDFPAPVFKVAGPYQYLVEMDGKEVARLPLFDVKVEATPTE